MKVLLFADIGTDWQGYYHVGDEAMFLQSVEFYQEFYPHAKLHALTSLPSHADLPISERRGLPWPQTLWAARLYFIKLVVKTLCYKIFRRSFFTSEQQNFIKFLFSQDLVHFTGGGNLTSECKHWMYYALTVACLSSLLNKPVLLSSQTIGPFSSWIDTRIAVWVLNMTDHIWLRTHTPQQSLWLQKAGVHPSKLSQSLDAAYFLLPLRTNRKISKKFRIGLSLHDHHQSEEAQRSLLQQCIKIALQKQHIELVLLPHVGNNNGKWDLEWMKKVIRELDPTISIDSPLEEIKHLSTTTTITCLTKSYTKSCNVVITSRYHGTIFALSQAIPCLSLISGEYQWMKNIEAYSFLFGSRASFFCIQSTDPQAKKKISHTFEYILLHHDELKHKLHKKNKVLRNEYTHHLSNLKLFIDSLLE